MMRGEIGRAAFGWAAFLVVVAGGMLLIVKPGTAEFVISVITLVTGVFFAAVVFVLVRVWNR